MRYRLIPFAFLLLLGGCGYFNSLYNANRRFADAERAALNGDRSRASREYREAIDRAAVSYRKYPDGRWADDALLLLGRARFALEEYDAAAAAMRTLLEQSQEPEKRSLAHAYLGASLLRLGVPVTAQQHLDSAASAISAESGNGSFVRLWRARALFETGRADEAWSDLAAVQGRRTGRDAGLEGIRRAFEARDSARAIEFFHKLAGTRLTGRIHQPVDSLLRRMAAEWSPSLAFYGSAPFANAPWSAESRDVLALTRAEIAVLAGDPETAIELALDVAEAVRGGIGSRARHIAASIRLQRADSPDALEHVRQLLLPAFDDAQALALMRRIKAAQILIQNGENPESSLSLFAAAELLRDDMGATVLAAHLFMQFAERQPQNAWAGKAVLAAHQLHPTGETAAALDRWSDNPYVLAVRGQDPAAAAIDRAEERLAFGLAGLRADALAEAIQRDVIVGRAVAVLDSTRLVARNDSIRIVCGTMIDSLRIAGIRADSTRSACLRGDSVRIAFVLTADTALLRDSVATPVRRAPATRGRAVPDTTVH